MISLRPLAGVAPQASLVSDTIIAQSGRPSLFRSPVAEDSRNQPLGTKPAGVLALAGTDGGAAALVASMPLAVCGRQSVDQTKPTKTNLLKRLKPNNALLQCHQRCAL